MNGSIYGELQCWRVDAERGTAEIAGSGTRRFRKPSARLDVKPLAHEVAELILAHDTDSRIKWRADGQAARAVLSEILPAAVKQTEEGRRRRFYAALDAELAQAGYSRHGAWFVCASEAKS